VACATEHLAHWLIQLQGFVFKFEHRSVSLNVFAVTLSRQDELSIDEIDNFSPIIDLSSDFDRPAQGDGCGFVLR